uniref:Trans-cinnamate 4-monooxygenase n=1 Tax=Fagus sylvatica TaxID=28930 RepID=A0A2N9FS41_FAGSY
MRLDWRRLSFLALFLAEVVAITISKLRGKRFKLAPDPIPVPVFGNWLQRNLVVVSSPELAKEVLHTQGVEFGSRTRNVVFDIFTGKGQDMVFTVYGEHWRKMRRIMTVSFFTNKVVQQYRFGWEDEAARVVEDVKKNPEASTTGIVIRRRLQLMMYNNMYRKGSCKDIKERRLQLFKDYFVDERRSFPAPRPRTTKG